MGTKNTTTAKRSVRMGAVHELGHATGHEPAAPVGFILDRGRA